MRPSIVDGKRTKRGVSIHASVKDATAVRHLKALFLGVSIHASVKDATDINAMWLLTGLGFNPRICKRCDRMARCWRSVKTVSIHASVKDATDPTQYEYVAFGVSIHASVKDATYYDLQQCLIEWFQSTHL